MLSLPFVLRSGVPTSALQAQPSFMPLFNGKDLAGWDTWLGRPHKLTDVPGLSKNEQGEYVQPIGLNTGSTIGVLGRGGGRRARDPHFRRNLRRSDHAGRIRATTTCGWSSSGATKRWPPREQAVRDSGLLLPLRSARTAPRAMASG